VIFADRDVPGLEAAARLMEHLQGRVRLELRVPPPPAEDWNDVLHRQKELPKRPRSRASPASVSASEVAR